MSISAPIIAVFNAKGGVGKTTSAVNLAACLAAFGRRVAVVDLDAQGNATISFGAGAPPTIGTYDLITGRADVAQVFFPTRFDGIGLIGATEDLGVIDVELAVNSAPRGGVLRDLLADLDTDLIIIDCPPAVSAMTVNALSSAHAVIVPANPTPYAHDGLMRTWRIVKRLNAGINPSLYVAGILLTQAEENADWGVEDVIRAELGGYLYPLRIPHDPKVFVSSTSYGLPACVFDPSGSAAALYLDLAQAVLDDEPRLLRVSGAALPPPAPHSRAQAQNRLAQWNAKAREDGLLDRPGGIPEMGTPLPPPVFTAPEAPKTCSMLMSAAIAAAGAVLGGTLAALWFTLTS